MYLKHFLLMCFLGSSILVPLHAQESKLTAMNPLGTAPPVRLVPMAPRPAALDGKTVYFVDVRYVGADIFLKEMMAWFSENMPKVKLEFRQKAGAYAESDPQLWDEIRQRGDAVVMAIGH